jgi:hypothetical protein
MKNLWEKFAVRHYMLAAILLNVLEYLSIFGIIFVALSFEYFDTNDEIPNTVFVITTLSLTFLMGIIFHRLDNSLLEPYSYNHRFYVFRKRVGKAIYHYTSEDIILTNDIYDMFNICERSRIGSTCAYNTPIYLVYKLPKDEEEKAFFVIKGYPSNDDVYRIYLYNPKTKMYTFVHSLGKLNITF